MKETHFIEKNKDKWKSYETELEKAYKDPDKLSEIFINVTDDLSYARTFYKNRSVRVYLNDLAQKIFGNIYKHKRSPLNRFFYFWKEELPIILYETRFDFRLSFFVFLLSFLIGVLSTSMDSEFPRIILGDDYVNMTIENIKKGDPMAVYKQQGQFGMSVGITINNIFVAFLTFIIGVFAAIGTVGILIRNGVMVGAFQYFFYEQGVFMESFFTIWMHGTLEISAIIIAGAAGITMGKGLLFPGTLSRIKSFQISAKRGLKIMTGLVPIFIIAGFIEGYVTRHTELSNVFRGFFILTCLLFILWYFVWYPLQKMKKKGQFSKAFNQIPPDKFQSIDFTRVKTTGQIFADTIILYRNNIGHITFLSLMASSFYIITVFLSHQADDFHRLFNFQAFVSNMGQFFVHPKIPYLPIICILLFTLFTISVNNFLLRKATPDLSKNLKIDLSLFLRIVTPITLLYFLIRIGDSYTPLLVMLVFPVILFWSFVIQRYGLWYIKGLGKTLVLLGAAYFKLTILSFTFFVFFLFILMGLFSPFLGEGTSILYFFIDIINWNLPFKGENAAITLHVLMLFFSMLSFFLLYPFLLFGIGLFTFSQIEVNEANSLKASIQQIGKKREVLGMVKE